MPKQMSSKSWPVSRLVAILTVVLTLQIGASFAVSFSERTLDIPGLRLIPAKFADWSMQEESALEPEVVAYLRPDDYILRTYGGPGKPGSISLFVAYFKSLQTSYGPHSPRVCLPGSGWLTDSWKVVRMPVPGRPDGIPVNQFVLEKDSQRILVTYWYQNDRRVWAEEFQVKLYLLPDLIRYRRSDISLVRLVTPLPRDNSLDAAWSNSTGFAQAIFPTLVTRLGHNDPRLSN